MMWYYWLEYLSYALVGITIGYFLWVSYEKRKIDKWMKEQDKKFVKSKQEESLLDLCSNCNHSRFDHTEKGEPIHCFYGGKGCGCDSFIENKDSEGVKH